MMIWILIYLSIGVFLSLYAESARVRTIERATDVPPDAWAAMSDRERKFLQSTVETMRKGPYKTWMLIGAGLLWPTQIVAWIAGEVMAYRLRRRADGLVDQHMASLVCSCPGCKGNLVTKPMVDTVEDANSDLVRFICPCGIATDWDFGPPVPILLRIVTTAPLGVGSEEAP